jgi:hypothetical protein
VGQGNDGLMGLPYWAWDEPTVSGEVFPKIVRERFQKFPPVSHSACMATRDR